MVSVHTPPQSNHPLAQTGRECISISLYWERRHLFIVRVRDRSRSLVSILQKYVSFLQELPRQGDEMQPDQESDRKQRGSCWADPHSCPGDVIQHLTGSFSIFMTSDKAP